MRPLSYAGYRFPPEIIQHAIWLYLRFTLSFRDVEELLAERGVDVSHETIRRWVVVFGPMKVPTAMAQRDKPVFSYLGFEELALRIIFDDRAQFSISCIVSGKKGRSNFPLRCCLLMLASGREWRGVDVGGAGRPSR